MHNTEKDLSSLQAERQRLLGKRQVLLKAFDAAAESTNKPHRLSRLFLRISQTNEFLKSLERIEVDTGRGRVQEAVTVMP